MPGCSSSESWRRSTKGAPNEIQWWTCGQATAWSSDRGAPRRRDLRRRGDWRQARPGRRSRRWAAGARAGRRTASSGPTRTGSPRARPGTSTSPTPTTSASRCSRRAAPSSASIAFVDCGERAATSRSARTALRGRTALQAGAGAAVRRLGGDHRDGRSRRSASPSTPRGTSTSRPPATTSRR